MLPGADFPAFPEAWFRDTLVQISVFYRTSELTGLTRWFSAHFSALFYSAGFQFCSEVLQCWLVLKQCWPTRLTLNALQRSVLKFS